MKRMNLSQIIFIQYVYMKMNHSIIISNNIKIELQNTMHY